MGGISLSASFVVKVNRRKLLYPIPEILKSVPQITGNYVPEIPEIPEIPKF
jgi:hypothetical protein